MFYFLKLYRLECKETEVMWRNLKTLISWCQFSTILDDRVCKVKIPQINFIYNYWATSQKSLVITLLGLLYGSRLYFMKCLTAYKNLFGFVCFSWNSHCKIILNIWYEIIHLVVRLSIEVKITCSWIGRWAEASIFLF